MADKLCPHYLQRTDEMGCPYCDSDIEAEDDAVCVPDQPQHGVPPISTMDDEAKCKACSGTGRVSTRWSNGWLEINCATCCGTGGRPVYGDFEAAAVKQGGATMPPDTTRPRIDGWTRTDVVCAATTHDAPDHFPGASNMIPDHRMGFRRETGE